MIHMIPIDSIYVGYSDRDKTNMLNILYNKLLNLIDILDTGN